MAVNNSTWNYYNYDNGNVYYSNPKDNNRLYRKNLATGENTLLAKARAVKNICITDKYIFFTYWDDGIEYHKAGRINKDGTNLVLSGFNIYRMQVYNNHVYYTSKDLNTNEKTGVCRTDLDFKNNEELTKVHVSEFIVYNNKLDYNQSGEVNSLNLSSLENTKLTKNEGYGSSFYVPTGVDLDENTLFINEIVANSQGKMVEIENQVVKVKGVEALEKMPISNNTTYGRYIVDNGLAYYLTRDKGYWSYNIETGEETLIFSEKEYKNVSKIGDYLFVTNSKYNEVFAYNLKTKEKTIIN